VAENGKAGAKYRAGRSSENRAGEDLNRSVGLADRGKPRECQHSPGLQTVRYEISPPPEWERRIARGALYVHAAGSRKGRDIASATEAFVEATRMGAERT
jgi:hypothetical protein